MNGVSAPPPPKICIGVGVTGHRAAHSLYAKNVEQIEAVIAEIFSKIDEASLQITSQATSQAASICGTGSLAPTRLHTLLVDGADQVASHLSLARNWELISPLPFGQKLNLAINAMPVNGNDARAILAGKSPQDADTNIRKIAIERIAEQAHLFELADQDAVITGLYLDHLDDPDNFTKAQAFALESSQRAALAGRILIEQSDIIIAIWDGKSTANIGGTGHTLVTALNLGAPVIWIDPASPEDWHILHAPESLAVSADCSARETRDTELLSIITQVICPDEIILGSDNAQRRAIAALRSEKWRPKSARITHIFRRIETLFGGQGNRFKSAVQYYETPDEIGSKSGEAILSAAKNLPGGDPEIPEKIDQCALQNFAWADGISSYMSDRYRGGMVWNFILSSFAIVGGIAYLPITGPEHKWGFALFEFLLLLAILLITYRGKKYRWHARWFETRRVAEYFRHSPLLLIIGVARSPGRWPQGTETSWPEWYARHALRTVGLPRVKVSAAYLRSALTALQQLHVKPQMDYHCAKSIRLKTVHKNLDRLSGGLFTLAIISVAGYLVLKGASEFNIVNPALVAQLSKSFTLLGVLFPTFGAAISGIRFFGDYDRFAAISEVTAERLEAINGRINLLLQANDLSLNYASVAELAQATDDVVISEIENWQSVFGGKHITVPV